MNPAYPSITNALLSSDILEEDYNIVSNETAQPSCISSTSLTVNPAYPSITNALLRGDILEEDYTQIDIVSNETAQPSHSSSTSLTFNPAYPRVTNALLSSNILEEDYTEMDIVSSETAQRRSCSSSSSELSYVEVQPVLDYEEIPDNIVSGVSSEQNCAYNITNDDPPPAYEEVVRSRANSLEDNCAYNTVDGMIRDNQEVYEVIPEREEEEDRTETYTPRGRGIRTLCRFWQGRVELAIRVTIITVSIIRNIHTIMYRLCALGFLAACIVNLRE